MSQSDMVEKVELLIFDDFQTDTWIEQDPTAFDNIRDMFKFCLRMVEKGYQVRFSYSMEKDTEPD